MAQMNSYDYSKYTAADVKAALEHDTCTIEDFKALLSPAAEPFLEQMAQRARLETSCLLYTSTSSVSELASEHQAPVI